MRRWGGQVKNAMGSVRLLEVGCGVGAQAVWLGNHGFLVNACDASREAIERAKQFNTMHHSVKFYAAALPGLVEFGFNPGTYDGVVDVCCLQHVDDFDASLAEIRTLLTTGGQLLSIIACADHSPVMREELAGATFLRLTQGEVHRRFMSFSQVKVESMTHTDDGANISHWIVVATK
jgi:2-polyprenyl-3-methyl-5-hydroxy-6-metoxy-1,4-benzoquinol methylase